MPSAKELFEKRVPVANAIRQMSEKVNAESRDFTAEEQETWDKANADYDALTRQIDRATRAESVGAALEAPAGNLEVGRGRLGETARAEPEGLASEDARALALQSWFQSGHERPLSDRQRQACQQLGFNPHSSELTIPLYSTEDHRRLREAMTRGRVERARENLADFRATLSGQVGASGGYLIPPETLLNRLEINLLWYGGVRQVAETITTSTGEPMTWPTADDTSNTGALLAESTTIGSSVDPSFAKVRWDAYKFSSKPVLVPYELLEDQNFALPNLLGNMLGERLGRITNTYQTTGSGASQPKGLVTCSSLGVTASSATAIAADELIDLYHSVDMAYRVGAGWMMNDGIVKYLRKLKDGDGQYLWQSGLLAGAPDTILGAPVTINGDMQSTVATATKTILFGQFSKYKIRRVNAVRFYRLQERYRDLDQDAFIAFLREDGNLLDAGTAPVKHLLQA